MNTIDRFKNYLNNKYSSATIESYSSDVNLFIEYVKRESSNISASDVYKYMSYLEDQDIAVSTRLRILSSLRTYSEFLRDRRINTKFYVPSDITIKYEQPELSYLTDLEVMKLLASFEYSPLGNRNKLMTKLVLTLGLKVSEVIKINLGDYDSYRGQIVVKGRIFNLSKDLNKEIRKFLKEDRTMLNIYNSSYLFPSKKGSGVSRKSFWRILDKQGKTAKINKNITPSVLRHTYSYQAIKSGVDAQELYNQLGYKDIGSVVKYQKEFA